MLITPVLLLLDPALLEPAAVEEPAEQLQVAAVTLTLAWFANDTAPVLASRRPFTVVPAAPDRLMLDTAIIVPTNVLVAAIVAEAPIVQ